MTRALAAVPLLFLFACSSGPEGVDATVFDAGIALEKDSSIELPDAAEDAGSTDTGTIARDAGDPGERDGAIQDAEPLDGDQLDGDQPDGDQLDGDQPDGDAEPMFDGGEDAGDAGAIDVGPVQLVEDFTDPFNEVFTCPDTTMVLPALAVENGTQCLGIDGSGCPDERGLPGPGSAECSDPNQNPFIGGGQCVSDFFSCFDPMGTCSNDGAGTFTWGNGATQIIQVDGSGRLIMSQFIPSNAALPCVIGLPEAPGGTRVIYTQQ